MITRFRILIWEIYKNFIVFYLRKRGISIGYDINIKGSTIIKRWENSSIHFGKNITINSSVHSNYVGINHKTIIIARKSGSLKIGNNVGMSGVSIFCSNSISIGDNVAIGGNVAIYDNDFHPLNHLDRRIHNEESINSKPIVINNDVFIGANSIILKGVTIGERTVVGAGSVVTKSFPPDCIVAGNPAKIVKKLNHNNYQFDKV